MTTPRSLRCRSCHAEYPADATHVCEQCWGPLDVAYDVEAVRSRVSRQRIEAGPHSMWRWRDLLPLGEDVEPNSLGEGDTPLVHARNLGEALGLRNLYLKNDTLNPTGSFKDRVVSVATTWARAHGLTTIGCASTGNLANSVAAYGARAGMRAVVFIPADLERAKVVNSAVYGPELVRIDGSYDDVNRLCSELADRLPWGFCNINLRPYYSEGSKTVTFETVEQLGWRLPDEIVVPVASGCQFVKHAKALRELVTYGLVAEPRRPVRLTGAQAQGCGPVATAYAAGLPEITPVRPSTVARSLAIGNPADGAEVLRLARGSGGTVGAATDEEILDGVELLARTEGMFAETAGGVTIAVLRKLARAGRWRGDEIVVAYITGHGLKTAESLETRLPAAAVVAPRLDDVLERLREPVGAVV